MNRFEKAAEFGAMMGKMAALDPANAVALEMGALGLLGGGLVGGISGALSPNKYKDIEFHPGTNTPVLDSKGQMIRKNKTRTRSAIENALTYAALGGLTSAAAGKLGAETMLAGPYIGSFLSRQIPEEIKDYAGSTREENIDNFNKALHKPVMRIRLGELESKFGPENPLTFKDLPMGFGNKIYDFLTQNKK